MRIEFGLKKTPPHIERSLNIFGAVVRNTERRLSGMRRKRDLTVVERGERYEAARRKVETEDLAERLRREHRLPPEYKLAGKLLIQKGQQVTASSRHILNGEPTVINRPSHVEVPELSMWQRFLEAFANDATQNK